jgi:hypothetical protein
MVLSASGTIWRNCCRRMVRLIGLSFRGTIIVSSTTLLEEMSAIGSEGKGENPGIE